MRTILLTMVLSLSFATYKSEAAINKKMTAEYSIKTNIGYYPDPKSDDLFAKIEFTSAEDLSDLEAQLRVCRVARDKIKATRESLIGKSVSWYQGPSTVLNREDLKGARFNVNIKIGKEFPIFCNHIDEMDYVL